MTVRAALYARVSTDDQRGNFSIPTQISECLAYLDRNSYTLVGDQYVDAQTGLSIAYKDGAIAAFVDDFTSREISRPGFDALLTFLESTGFDVLIVHALDRLARDPYIRQTLELETVKEFSAEIRRVLSDDFDLPSLDKRRILELLDIQVYLDFVNNSIRLTGLISPQSIGLLSKTYLYHGQQTGAVPFVLYRKFQ